MTLIRHLRLPAVLLAFALALLPFGSFRAFAVPAGTQLTEGENSIVIIHTNDVHCGGITLTENKNGVFTSVGYGGVEQVKQAAETQYGADHVTLVDAGDAIQGQPLGTLSQGGFVVDIMSQMGYDVAIPGNHEFDYGVPRFLQLVEQAQYPYVSCNILDTSTNKPLLDPYKMISYSVGGQQVDVAYVGITTPVTLTSTSPAVFQNAQGRTIYSFYEGDNGQALYDQVQKTVNDALAAGAEYVIAIAHLGMPASSSVPEIYTSSALVAHTTGIDAVIDGHTHEIYNYKVKNANGEEISVSQAGTQLQALGTLTITPDGSPDPSDISSDLEIASEQKDIPQNEGTVAYVDQIEKNLSAILDRQVGQNDVPLSFLDLDDQGNPWWYAARMHETNLGDFVADAYRALTGADIGFVNGGGVRWSKVVENIEPGAITYGNLIDINPYANSISLVEVKGQTILDALEYSVRMLTPSFDDATEASGGFLQVSGLSFTADVATPSPVVVDDDDNFVSIDGPRRVSNVKVNGKNLDPNATYKLGTISYLVEGGSGYTMLKDAKVLIDGAGLDYDALMKYLQEDLQGVISTGYESLTGNGRINLVVADGRTFPDVAPNSWYGPAVEYMNEIGVLKGYADGFFGPDDPMTRAQLATTLWRYLDPKAAGSYTEADATNTTSFTDVPNGRYFTAAVDWANNKGYMVGYNNGSTFAPYGDLTFEQLVTVLYRAFGPYTSDADTGVGPGTPSSGNAVENVAKPDMSLLDNFADGSQVSSWAREAMAWALEEGLVHGADGSLIPTEVATRARTAVVLYNGIMNDVIKTA